MINTIPIKERLIISLYDYTGNWPRPYIKAGYPVMLWDKKVEGDILTERAWDELMGYSSYIYGLIGAPPCTFFAGSGARWWPNISEEDLTEMIALVQIILIFKEQCPNLNFWVFENPVGRIEKLIPEIKPFRKLLFNPCDYGDPYTKKTILWGEFNSKLQKNPVLPLYGSMMHLIPPGPKRQELRSATPLGFSQAFFNANR